MTDEELLAHFRRGFIPGPLESEEEFLSRVQQNPPLHSFEWAKVASKTLPSFGWAIDSVSIFYSNQSLYWWEGAATWESNTPSIQLKTSFRKGSYLGYHLIDVLAHEAVHVARIKFSEPQFEEILAYSTAKERWRRFLGPMFTYSWEPLIFLLLFIIGGLWYWIPLCAIIFFLGRLLWRHQQYRKCLKCLPLSVVVCLTDQEMRCFNPSTFVEDLRAASSTPRTRLITLLIQHLAP